jgi:hypothetical protein
VKGGRYFRPLPPLIGGGEREGRGRPLGSTTDAGVEPERRTGSAHRVPLCWVADEWARGQYLNVARPGLPQREHCSDPNPLATDFKISKLNRIVNWENQPYRAPNIPRFWMPIDWKIRNNFTFGIKFKLKTEFE